MTRVARTLLGRRDLLAAAAATAFAAGGARAAGLPQLRVGVLQFGTVSWELDVIKAGGLDAAHGFELVVTPFGGNDAADVALMGNAVDAVVEDWLMVARDRAQGGDLTFVWPYTKALGGLMVPAKSDAQKLGDLAGRRFGVAGGPLDKSWLLLQAYAREKAGLDPAASLRPAYAAPPLLNAKLESGEFEAVLNYWNWCVPLEAAGFRRLLSVQDLPVALGIAPPPQLGYVVHEPFVRRQPQVLAAFAAASKAARARLATSDEEWARLRALTRIGDDATFALMRQRYRDNIVASFDAADVAAATKLYEVLASIGGPALVGEADGLPPGTFTMLEPSAP